MTNYREILRLKNQGYSKRTIALAASCSRNTVSEVLQRAEDHGLTWPDYSVAPEAQVRNFEQQLSGKNSSAVR